MGTGDHEGRQSSRRMGGRKGTEGWWGVGSEEGAGGTLGTQEVACKFRGALGTNEGATVSRQRGKGTADTRLMAGDPARELGPKALGPGCHLFWRSAGSVSGTLKSCWCPVSVEAGVHVSPLCPAGSGAGAA